MRLSWAVILVTFKNTCQETKAWRTSSQVTSHIYLVLFKCNRVTSRFWLGTAALFAIGLTFESMFGFVSLSSGLGILSGLSFGFLCGLTWTEQDYLGAGLAIFLCLGSQHQLGL